MHRIIYFSSATHFFNLEELDSLLLKSRMKNAANGITGLLIYIDGDFIQILEGEKEKVQNLFNLIKLDKKHSTVISVFDQQVPGRMFENWAMGFSQQTIQSLRKNNSFSTLNLDELKESKGNNVTIFLETFIKSHRIV
jgi:hypothetical protein